MLCAITVSCTVYKGLLGQAGGYLKACRLGWVRICAITSQEELDWSQHPLELGRVQESLTLANVRLKYMSF